MVRLISVNERGALTLPKEVRDQLGVARGGQLVMDIDDEGEVTLRAGVVMPIEIYSKSRLVDCQRMNEAPLSEKKLRWKKPL